MAKIYLETTDTTFTLSNAATVYGAAGDQKVIVNEGVTGVTFDQLVERVDLPGSFASFKYQQAGNGLQVYSGTTLLATIPLQADGTQIVTSGGSVMASLAAGVMTLGGSTVSDAAAGAVTPSAAAITTAVTTGSTFVPVPTFSISTATSTSAFEGTSATYTVLLNTPQATASTVKLVATPSTGAVAADLGTMTVTGATLAADGTLTFAPGAVAATVTLPIGFDSLTETGESVTLALSNPSTGMALGASSVTTTLTDPAPPTFKLTSNAVAGTPTQEGNTINFTVTPSGVVVSPTTMTINVVGNDSSPLTNATAPDFNPSSTTVTFAAGETAPKTVSITVATDTMSEGLEDYAATLYDGSFLPITGAVVTGTINDPVPALTLAADKTAVDEGGSVVYTVTSTLAAPTVGITVPYTLAGSAVAGTDHTGTATGTITIAAGSKTGSVTVNTIADNATDGTDTLIMTLGTPSNGTITTGSATTTIADTSLSLGAAEIALSGAASVDEGGDLVYTVTRGSAVATGSTLTIPYTLTGNAANGTDYTGSAPTGNFVMAAGTSSASVTLKVTADSLTEATAENIIMTLGALPTGTTAAAGRGTPITTVLNDTSKTVVGETGTLTTGATDSVLNKTTINGVLDTSAAATNRTWHVSDNISGTAAASDALNAIVLGNTANNTVDSYAGLTTTLIENFNFRYIDNNDSATATGATIDATTLNGATKLAVKSSTVNGTTNSDTFTINGAVATAALEVADNSSLLNVKFDNAGTVSTADSMKLITSGGSTGIVTLDDAVNNGFVTVNVTTETAASTLKGLDAGSSLTTLNVSGNQGLTIINPLPTTLTTLNAGANSGAVNLTTASSTLTATGGTGTTDVLTLNTIPTGTISGFETVVAGAKDSALSLATVTGATKLGVATGLTSAAFTNAAATTNTIGLSGNYQPNGAALTTSTSLTTGTLAYTPVSLATVATDTLTIAVDNGGTANTGTYTAGAITATNVESLTLTTADWTAVTLGGITQTVATTAAASMTASGASNLTLGTVADVASLSDTTGVDTYNFGGVAGTLSATIAANGSVSVTGAAGIDTITASADMTRSTSARTQTYNLGNGNDSITFQSGTVALVGAVANKLVLNGDAGDDSFRYATAAANTDLVTIAGGAGSDTLFVTGAPANGPTATASGLEGITFNNTADATTTLAWTGGATDIVTITELNGNAETLNITTVAGSGVLNTGNWVVQGWGAGDFLNISGDAGNDTLGVNTGVASGEVLKGGAGNDTLNGFAGADSITGGLGADRLTGGAGIDDFNLVKADSTLAAMDIITDFRAATGDNAGAADTITITDQKAVASVVNTTVLARADATFAAALDAVATLNATDLGLSVFTYGGNTYAYVETIATGIAYVADDCLIQIVGTPWAAGTVIAGSGLGIDAV